MDRSTSRPPWGLALPASALLAWPASAADEAVGVTVLEDDGDRTVISYVFDGFDEKEIVINGELYTQIILGGESPKKVTGAPALPDVARSIIIPDDAAMSVQLLRGDFYELEGVAVAPSKGFILRTVDPADVPYTFGEVYQTNAFWPAEPVTLREPYVMRDYRGVVVEVNPFQYNPVTGVLRVYTEMTLEVAATGPAQVNAMPPRAKERTLSRAFHEMYGTHFINYDPQLDYPPLDETGDMLVICHDAWIGNMTPFVNHKNAIGIDTTVVGVSTIGNDYLSIRTYILDLYNTSDLAFVLLVGDAAQVACYNFYGGASDPTYALLAGQDDYPDIMVGRFSAETAAQVDTQVERTIEYEQLMMNQEDWFWKATGIASNEGPGHYGEYDDEHMDLIRDDLLAVGYTEVDQIYDPYGTAAMVHNALNAGRGMVNYCGHGATGGWLTTGFSNSDVDALVNDNMLPVITSVACDNGNFPGGTCFAEAWLRATHNGEPTGAVAAYMSSVSQSWDPPMEAQDEYIDRYCDQSYSCYGTLCFAGSGKMMDEYGAGGVEMFRTWHVFGDPSLWIVGAPEPGFALEVTPESQTVCAPADAVYDVEVPSVLGYADPVTLSAAGEPAGTTVSFSVNPVAPPGTSIMTVSDTAAGQSGTYLITVTGDGPDMQRSTVVTLDLVGEPPSFCPAAELFRLTASDAEDGDSFGSAVSAYGDDLLVGAMMGDGPASDDTGSAYLFDSDGAGWVEGDKLTADDGAPGDRFGAAVSLSDGRALVGAYADQVAGPQSGSAYIFTRNAGGSGSWGQQAKLVADDAFIAAKFGQAVSLDGNVALIGAIGDLNAGVLSGAAYIFERNQGGANHWGQLAKLTASDAAELAEFGRSVSVKGDLAVVGAPGNEALTTGGGAAYVFQRSAGGLKNWGQVARLSDPDAPPGNHFGTSVAIRGDTIVIGATNADGCGTRVYVYRHDGAGWPLHRTFISSNSALPDRFGSAIALNGDVAVIGALADGHQGPATGAGYVYLLDSAVGQEQARLTASDAAPNDEFASSVSVRCNTAVFGAPGNDSAGTDAGAAYVVRGVSDCNENGIVDICDIESGYSADNNANGIPDECEDACWSVQIRIAQESAPGVGDFQDNILGCLVPYSTITSADDFYALTAELQSYDGSCVQLLKSNRSYLLLADTSDGMSLVVIHDRALPPDPDGGHAEMSFELFGDSDGAVRTVEDDPDGQDFYTGGAGATFFTSGHSWGPARTDGQILSDLDDEWSLLVQFTEVDGDPTSPPFEGLTTWYAYSADCGQIELALEPDRRVRLEYIAAASAPADLNGDGVVDVLDLLLVLGAWGNCSGCPEDINGDGIVDVLDMLEVLAAWGPCG